MVKILCFCLCLLSLFLPRVWQHLKGPSCRQLSAFSLAPEGVLQNRDSISILDQPFFAWERGSQSEVFLSRDRRYVLKIPRNHKTKSYLLGRFKKRRALTVDVLESYRISGRELEKETGVIYVHLAEPIAMPKGFSLHDRLGRRLKVDVGALSFALQEKKPLLSEALQTSDPEESKRILQAFLDLVSREKEKGWLCKDYAFFSNLGYEKGVAFRIDIGSYVPVVEEDFPWNKIVKPIYRHLEHRNEDSLCNWLEERVGR